MPIFTKKRKKQVFFWSVLVLLVLLFSFSFLYRSFFEAHSHIVPAEGGILTESTIGKIKNISPLAREKSLLDRDIQSLIFRGLLQYDPVEERIVDGLAHLQVKNASVYELTIKDNAYFQDGSPVTVEDVLFTFESVIQNPHFTNDVLFESFQYVTLEIVDRKTIQFRLIEPNFFFPALLTVPILPKKYFKNAYIEQITDSVYSFNKNPIGTGPYKLKNIVPNVDGSFRVFLTKNTYYYGEEPKIDQIVFYVYPDFSTLQQSSVVTDMYTRIPFAFVDDFQEKLNQRVALQKEYIKQEYILPRFVGIFFNLDRPVVKSISVRRAFSFTFDKEKILEKEPGWKMLHSFFFFKNIDGSHILSPKDARKILTEGGFPYNDSLGVRTHSDGEPFTLRFITSTNPPVFSRFAQIATQQWEKELDIDIDLQILPPQEFQKALSERDYDMVLFGKNYSQNIDSLSTWHSSQTGQYNLSNLTNDSIDFLINEIHQTGSQTDLFELNERLLSLVPAIVLATPRYYHLYSTNIHNFEKTFGGKNREHAHRYIGAEEWYFLQKQDWNIPKDKSAFVLFFEWLFGFNSPPFDEKNISTSPSEPSIAE